MIDFVHRILTGQTLTTAELRIAGWAVFIWFLADMIEWSDWLLHWK